MPSTKEIHFEEHIEKHFLGAGYSKLDANAYDADLALWPDELIGWIQDSQPDTWAYLKQQFGAEARERFLDAFTKQVRSEKDGMLELLRHGFHLHGTTVKLAQFEPNTLLNPETLELYQKNRLGVARQVHQSVKNPDQSVDMVLTVNGIPLATLELKNEMTGQNVQHAISQYRRRNPNDPLFRFKERAFVHFAADTSEVHYCTKLRGEDSFFLPFNKGHDEGAGNPPNPNGHKTSYLWEDTLQKDSLLDIVRRFLNVQREQKKIDGKVQRTETLIFPRYHQLDAVRNLVDASRNDGAGTNYLVQHSAGSGKSNTIAWLAHRLSTLHDDAYKERVFDSIIVLTDRVVLDKQLQNTIYQFDHQPGVVKRIEESSDQLRQALESGDQIIITTIQKFPFVSGLIGKLPNRRYAVIIDEAHSGQSGETSKRMKEVLADPEDAPEELADWERRAWEQAKARGKQNNLSLFAFTATPKSKTLEVFGVKGEDGNPHPFHLYTMKQAIQEGFILDVLQNYTTYKSFFGLQKSINDDPEMAKGAAKKAIARFLDLHPTNIQQKVAIIIEHFQQHVQHKISGRARAMVVTSSRQAARKYRQAFDKHIEDHNVPWSVLVAFTGKLVDKDTGEEFTEANMNGFPDSKTASKFNEPEYRIMIVADKFQTGYDQPLLYAMYVDKVLRGLNAVQTLSRLNRTMNGKDGTFVLDFVNSHDEILEAFKPYYRDARIESTTDPQDLYRLRSQLLGAMVFGEGDVQEFCKVYFAGDEPAKDHPALVQILQGVMPGFDALDDDQKDDFARDLKAFTNLYQFIGHVGHFTDPRLEQFFVFCRALRSYLPKGKGTKYDIEDDVALEYFRLEKKQKGAIQLGDEAGAVPKGPGEGGVPKEEKKDRLSKIIKEVNQRLGTDWTDADKVLVEQMMAEAMEDEQIATVARNNTEDKYRIFLTDIFENLVMDRLEKNEDRAKELFNNEELRQTFLNYMSRETYRLLRSDAGGQ